MPFVTACHLRISIWSSGACRNLSKERCHCVHSQEMTIISALPMTWKLEPLGWWQKPRQQLSKPIFLPVGLKPNKGVKVEKHQGVEKFEQEKIFTSSNCTWGQWDSSVDKALATKPQDLHNGMKVVLQPLPLCGLINVMLKNKEQKIFYCISFSNEQNGRREGGREGRMEERKGKGGKEGERGTYYIRSNKSSKVQTRSHKDIAGWKKKIRLPWILA